jgi:PhoPQ-activated pathogenicity-related protein
MEMSMRRYWPAILCALTLLPLRSRADLASYLARPEPVYKWEKRREIKVPGGTVYDLHLVSQTWEHLIWEHRLLLAVPDKLLYSHFCILYNTGGNGGQGDIDLGMQAAQAYGGPVAILLNIPNQPLFGGKTEDNLVVYTWLKFLETGDADWPLHFPMAKAVIKAMDAIQAFTRTPGHVPVDSFLVTGASKRGWTTWLVGASGDQRVKGIAPMVIDTLNIRAQIAHQIAAYGEFSEQIQAYRDAGLLDVLRTDKGKPLLALEDPYIYRDKLTLPKLLIFGTNDAYWTGDALNLYWNDLKGPKWILYNPNVGHGLNTLQAEFRVMNALGAFAQSIASRTDLPPIRWNYRATADGVDLTVTCSGGAVSATLWHAAGPTHDLRKAVWTSAPMAAAGQTFTTHFPKPASGYAETYGDVTFTRSGRSFNLSTQIYVLQP